MQTAVCGTIWREYAESNKEVFLVEECAERSYVHGSKRRVTIDIQGAIPVFIDITDGKVHDVNVLDILIPEAGSYIVMDRGYLDFERLCRLHQALSFFVIRAKRNLQFQRRYSHAGEKSTGVRSDQTVLLTGLKTSMIYPDPIRRISYYSVEIDKRLVFLTNDFNAPACTIAALYRYRWQVDFCSPAASVTSAAYPPRLVRTTGGTRSGQEAFAWGPISCS